MLHQIGFPYEIDYYDVELEIVVIHHILVLEKTSKKDLDGSVILNCIFH